MHDFQFIYPQFFLMFAIPLIWLVYTLTTKKRVEQTIFKPEILKKLTSSTGGLSLKTRTILAFFSTLFMIVALARPVINKGDTEIDVKSVDVIFAIDISKSMLANDRYPNRLEFAKKKVIDIIKQLKSNRIGVIAFANQGYTVVPLTLDRDGAIYLVKNIDSQNISEQGTSIKRVLYSVDAFLKDNPDRVVVLLTDGGDNTNYSDEVALAKKMGLRIFVIGTASKHGAPITLQDGSLLKDSNGAIVITKFNPAIKELAFQTGGIFVNGVNSDRDVEAIANEIDRLESSEIKKEKLPIYQELFIYPLIISLLLLFPTFYSLPSMRKFRKLLFWKRATIFLLLLFSPKLEAGIFDWWYINKAEESYQNGEYQKAIQSFLQLNSSDETNFNIANSYYRSGEFDKAIEYYKKVRGEHQREALYNLGNAYVQKGNLEKAIQSYQKSLEIEEDPKARENLEWAKNLLNQQKN
ncbi:MAG TPA: tetratricopeptide repeat protein, partial [Campylobacterales bacterium]|nr:tetratricopeptide repeat protein [Campylobacterales bacterium]